MARTDLLMRTIKVIGCFLGVTLNGARLISERGGVKTKSATFDIIGRDRVPLDKEFCVAALIEAGSFFILRIDLEKET